MATLETLKDTGRKAMKTLIPRDEEGTDILDTLKQEHDEVKELLGQLVDTESAASRKSLLKKIKAALVPHVRAEEKVVYDRILALKAKKAKIDGEEGYMEHGLADKMLASLGKITNAASAEFSAGAKVLKELVEHHVQEEERNVWKDVRKNFSDDDRIEMNREFEAAKKKVRIPA
jgi:hemerythrin-like domain-containing protein